MDNAEKLLTFMHQLADAADDIARTYFRKAFKSSLKADQTPVTEADQKIEENFRAMIHKQYSSHGIMGEEFGAEKSDAEYVWVIDPIDGTKAFIAGVPTFTTLIGLLKKGEPCAGMVSQAIERKRWCALIDAPSLRGAERRSNPAMSAVNHGLLRSARNDGALIAATTSMGYFTPEQEQGLKKLEQAGMHITYVGDAYSYMMLAEGKLDAVFDVCLKPHDILPLIPILNNAGLTLQFFDAGGLSSKPTGNIVVARDAQTLRAILDNML